MFEEIKPKVSVCVITYNQEKYIGICLKSIIEQKANFSFEIIVADDCSTDKTPKIIEEFVKQYPGIVKPVFNKKNVGHSQNYFIAHKLAKGQYIAHVDGDDYWLPGKLNYQVGIMDKNVNLVFIADYIGNPNRLIHEHNAIFDAKKLFIENNPSIHSSKLYRSEYVITEYEDRDYWDFEMNLRQLAENGECILTKQTTFFRSNSDTSVRNKFNANLLRAYINIFDFTKTIKIDKAEIDKIYNQHIGSYIKLIVTLNDVNSVNDIKNITKTCSYELNFINQLYLLIASHYLSMSTFRLLLITKRKFISHLNMNAFIQRIKKSN